MSRVDVPPNSSNAFSPGERNAVRGGLLVGALVVLGLVAWTSLRVREAMIEKDEFAAASQQSEPAPVGRPRVQVLLAVATEWSPEIKLSGTLESERSAALGFPLAGRLIKIDAVVGQEVAAGRVLAMLDAREVRMRLAAAQAQRRLGELQLAFATEEETRTLGLVERGVLAQEGGIKANRQRLIAAAELDVPRAQESLASLSLGEHTLRAPFGGTVIRAPGGVGALVGAGEPLFEIVDTNRVRFTATVTEEEAVLIEPGSPLWLQSEQGSIQGVVRSVLKTLEPTTRRVPVIGEFEHTNGMRVGAYVEARLQAAQTRTSVRLPRSALRPGAQDELFVVAPDGRLELRKVAYIVDAAGRVFVTRGVSAGDRVVTEPTESLTQGLVVDSVQVAESDQP